MELTLDTGKGHYHIRAYGNNFIQINEQKFSQSLVVTPHRLIYPFPPQRCADCNSAHLHTIIELNPSIVVFGSDENLFPDPHLVNLFYRHNIGLEVMTFAAACRTYTVLMSEERHVAAVLLLTE
ncbi:hypothetical protein BEV13_05045 [Rickettsiella grylli]|uniref:Mth938-like domain-containing protein n=1 Tax=Rickettsiella grylli TaxID=59196 RepID=UPI0008FD4726|nr:Mth938-like domain-containing protein [Rickettsiella grylli]OIZ99755.1 hypothetical protein BEV13_05045 [Rickettsiella grylli]